MEWKKWTNNLASNQSKPHSTTFFYMWKNIWLSTGTPLPSTLLCMPRKFIMWAICNRVTMAVATITAMHGLPGHLKHYKWLSHCDLLRCTHKLRETFPTFCKTNNCLVLLFQSFMYFKWCDCSRHIVCYHYNIL